MKRIRLDEDVRPLSDFRSNAASMIRQVRESRRPLVLTQRGHSAAVLLGVTEYEQMIEELELLRDVRTAEQELADGLGVSQATARAKVLSQLRR